MTAVDSQTFSGQQGLTVIGTIHTPYSSPQGMPIEPGAAGPGTVVVDEAFRLGLRDLEGFERMWLLFLFHRSGPARLSVTPFLDQQPHGVFSTRAPSRPSSLGLSAVRLLSVDRAGGVLCCDGLDIVDGTPLLDIKPYVPRFDAHPGSRAGWLDSSAEVSPLSDKRFLEP